MNKTIVGFLADLGGTESEVRHCLPVVQTESGLAVVGTRDVQSDSHLIPAQADGPGIHMLPPEAHVPFLEQTVDGDVRDDNDQTVVLLGPELARNLTTNYPDGPLTAIIAQWPVVTSEGHLGAVQQSAEFIALRREATAALGSLMLERLRTHSDAAKPLFDAFESIAPEEDLEYITGLGAFYRLTGQTRFDKQLVRRAKTLGVSHGTLQAEIARLIAESQPATSDSAESVAPSAAEQVLKILQRLNIDQSSPEPNLYTAASASGSDSRYVSVDDLTIGAFEDLVRRGGYRLALEAVTVEPLIHHDRLRFFTPARALSIHDASASLADAPSGAINGSSNVTHIRRIDFVVDHLQIIDPEGESVDGWSYPESTSLSGANL